MTTRLKARFDGHALIPEQPVDLPANCSLDIEVTVPSEVRDKQAARSVLEELVEVAAAFPANPDAPSDGAAQHDHYLYGAAKRP
ncbi:MAG TPA: hypothetical protein VGP72_22275 [Planctomycetota bacterium]